MKIPLDEEEDLEEDPEEDLEEDEDLVIGSEPTAEPAPASASESSVDGGPGWLVESGSESSHEWRLEWMADCFSQ